jgi:hypothetical protein
MVAASSRGISCSAKHDEVGPVGEVVGLEEGVLGGAVLGGEAGHERVIHADAGGARAGVFGVGSLEHGGPPNGAVGAALRAQYCADHGRKAVR